MTNLNSELKTKLDESIIKVNEYVKREDTIKTKENALEKTNYELEFQKNRANEIKELMMIVFKNPVVRESTYNNFSDYGNGKNENGGVTREVE